MKHKYLLKVQHGHYENGQLIITKDGWNKCIVIYLSGQIVHTSELHHPESKISTVFRNKTFIAIGDQIFTLLDDNTIELDSFDIKALDAEFDKILSKFTKEEVQEWLKLDRLNQYGK